MATTITRLATSRSLWFDIGWSDEENNDHLDYEDFQEELTNDIDYQNYDNANYSLEPEYFGGHGLPW